MSFALPVAARSWTLGRGVSLALRLTITLAIVGYLASRIEWSEFAHRLRQSDALLLGSACLLVGTTYLIGSLRWWLLLRVQEIVVSVRSVLAITLIGQFFNAYLLGSVGGDAVRAVYLWRLAPSQKTHATLSIVMDRGVGLFVLLCFALATLPWHLQELTANDRTSALTLGLLAAFGAMVAAGLALMLVPFARFPAPLRRLWLKVPGRHVPELVVGGFRRHGRALQLTLLAVLCSALIYLVVFLAGWYLAAAIGLNVTYLQILMILSVVICVVSLPISIGGHGVREGAFVLMFAAFGITDMSQPGGAGYEVAVLYSLLFFALFLVWSLAGGLVYMTFRNGSARPPLEAGRPRAG